MEKDKVYAYRLLSRIVIEAQTPFSVGSGDGNIATDALVVTDANGLPYIPGTSLAGVIRHLVVEKMGEQQTNQLFGFQASDGTGRGSEIIFSDAQMLGQDQKVLDGLQAIDFTDDFYCNFVHLPIRQHVCISERGTAYSGGKFDEQVTFKGTRFCFEIELVAEQTTEELFKQLLSLLTSHSFRLGGGTRNGFGEVSIVSCQTRTLNLNEKEDLHAYLQKTSSLAEQPFWLLAEEFCLNRVSEEQWNEYELKLEADDFFLFGSGLGNEVADMTPVSEKIIVWSDKDSNGKFQEDNILIPATSVKGALSHRVAYYYNRLCGCFADAEDTTLAKVGCDNGAVRSLFGDNDPENLKRGNVLFSDIIVQPKDKIRCQLFNHVAIDRLTGGALNGALFNEQVVYGNGDEYVMKVLVDKQSLSIDSRIEQALECALKDIAKGLLPLGGSVNRGNGCFRGTIVKNGDVIYGNN